MNTKLLIAVCLCAASLAICCQAATDQLFNCAGAAQLGTPSNSNCCQLCACLGTQQRLFAMDAIQSLCKRQCMQCVEAANDSSQCPDGNAPLPQACSQGMAGNAMVKSAMDTCISMFLKDTSSLRQVPGC